MPSEDAVEMVLAALRDDIVHLVGRGEDADESPCSTP